ncbi:cytochrome P450 [Trichodelitschia bisporula]|uniref:Cytochrome P450 n=1 Tax=Trichodelitschia bisporula TaxID=703511 RepID=A0A6G1I737_9PEZI|nr:cytochrome P450 [Trichodelitschia bisporula]
MSALASSLSGSAALLALAGLVTYVFAGAVYRLYFHPLAKFPGPKIAALTTWYEGWYDYLWLQGKFTFHLADLHKKYGPIVRIGPNEVHIKDPEFFSQIYTMSSAKIDKYEYYYSMLGNPEATFPTIAHETHKSRRAALAPFFSTAAVLRFQPVVQRVADRLCSRMRTALAADEPIPLFFAFRGLTVDIVSEYLFGASPDILERPDWGRSFYGAWRGLWELSPLIRQIPGILAVFRWTPRWLLKATNPKALEVLDMETQTDAWTARLLATPEAEIKKRPQRTVLWEVAHSNALPAEERTFKRLAVDGNNILAAGFETTGNMLSHMMYGVLSQPAVHARLCKELENAIPDPESMPNSQVLEKLPYLNAVVKETLRQGVGAFGRLSRVNRSSAVRYGDWLIPSGCAYGMSPLYVLWDETLFPDPGKFDPERWLGADAKRLEHYLVSFGRGPRLCVGMNLANAELYVVGAAVVRRFPTLRLWETGPEDVKAIYDYFGGMWRFEEGSDGLQVKG